MTRQKVSKYIALFGGELLIPVLGYFFWNWNIYFIFLFMFLDLLAYNVLFAFKLKKIVIYQYGRITQKRPFLIGGMLLLLFSTLIFTSYSWLFTHLLQTDFRQEIIDFLSYEDMGFPQGYILLPLIILMAYMNYKMEFLFLRKFMQIDQRQLLKDYLRDNIAAIILVVILGVCYLSGLNGQIYYLVIGLIIYLFYRVILLNKEMPQ